MTNARPAGQSWEVPLDSRRRPTLPAELLAAARVDPGERLVARPDGEGRIVLETRGAIRARIRTRFKEDRAREGRTGSSVEGLFEERRRDPSLS